MPIDFWAILLTLLCPAVQYYDRSSKILGEIKNILNTDLTSDDRLGDLETFKKDASAYGAAPPLLHCEADVCVKPQSTEPPLRFCNQHL